MNVLHSFVKVTDETSKTIDIVRVCCKLIDEIFEVRHVWLDYVNVIIIKIVFVFE